jgi:hypothetical protein
MSWSAGRKSLAAWLRRSDNAGRNSTVRSIPIKQVSAYGGEGGGGAKRSAEQLETENAGLRHEIEYLRQQRDILKKTLGILSETPSSAFNGSTR